MNNINIEEIKNDKVLAEKIQNTNDPKVIADLFNERGFEVTVEDVKQALELIEKGEFSEEDLDNVSGGWATLALGGLAIAGLIGFLKGLCG